MNDPDPQNLNQALKDLAAGYVLGDLSSEEAEMFHQLMSQTPALKAEVESLQQALEMMPYALSEQKPKAELRSLTLNAIQAEAAAQTKPKAHAAAANPATTNPTATTTAAAAAAPALTPERSQRAPFHPPAPNTPLQQRLTWLLSGIAIGCAAVFGISALKSTRSVPGFAATPQTPSAIQAAAQQAPQLEQVWQGFRAIAQDHNDSLREANGPVDFTAQQASDVLVKAPDFQTTLAALPVIPQEKGELLGGSKCKFGKTAGLRLSYRVSNLSGQVSGQQVSGETDVSNPTDSQISEKGANNSHIVSAYQLELNGDQFPQFLNSYIALRQLDGTSIVLWREEAYLYALVADLPPVELSALAQEISQI